MTAVKSILAILLGASALSACASAPPPVAWSGRAPSLLSADQAACHKETDDVDLAQANGYSDPKYGVASALAEAVDRDDPLKGHQMDARHAAFITCMSDKGWHPG
jgi:hypothetical protein